MDRTTSVTLVILPIGACVPAAAGDAPADRIRLVRLPFGSVRPEGWLKRQLEIDADGLIRHLLDPGAIDRVLTPGQETPSEVSFQRCVYREGPIVLAGLTGDEVFVRKAAESVEKTLAEDPESLGGSPPEREAILYGRARQARALVEHCELTGEARIVPWLSRFFLAWARSDAKHGWSAYERETYAGPEPVVLQVKGRRIPEWGMEGTSPANAADPPPEPGRLEPARGGPRAGPVRVHPPADLGVPGARADLGPDAAGHPRTGGQLPARR